MTAYIILKTYYIMLGYIPLSLTVLDFYYAVVSNSNLLIWILFLDANNMIALTSIQEFYTFIHRLSYYRRFSNI